jgi:O-antigen ligase
MTTLSTAVRFDRAFFMLLADWLAVGVAIALPWSTTASGICIALWLAVLLPTLDMAALRREIATAAGGLPVLLWCLGAVGMVWASVDWSARLGGLDGFNRLLAIPLLFAQYRRSTHGYWVIWGFLVSSALVLIASFVIALFPGLNWRDPAVPGIPAHDDIYQSSAFLICTFALLGFACDEGRKRHWGKTLGLIAIGTAFLVDFAFATFSRAALLVAPVLVALLGWRERRGGGLLAACVLLGAVGIGAWFAAPSLRARIDQSFDELADYLATDKGTSIGEHTAFLKESLAISVAAPIFGHGTGSIPEEFRKITAGKAGASAEPTVNPHNQTFAVTIQIGLVGALVLWSMWVAHLLLFRGDSVIAWCGKVVIAENIVSSTFHTHLFDFNNGWLYVFGVGVLGGMVLRERAALPAKTVLLR